LALPAQDHRKNIKNAGREVRTINRTDIKSLKALNMSSMPTGLEKQINQQQTADFLAFLRKNKEFFQ